MDSGSNVLECRVDFQVLAVPREHVPSITVFDGFVLYWSLAVACFPRRRRQRYTTPKYLHNVSSFLQNISELTAIDGEGSISVISMKAHRGWCTLDISSPDSHSSGSEVNSSKEKTFALLKLTLGNGPAPARNVTRFTVTFSPLHTLIIHLYPGY